MNDAPRLGANPVSNTGNVSSILTGAATTENATFDQCEAAHVALGAYIAKCDASHRTPRQVEASRLVVDAMVDHAVRITIKAGICTLMDQLESHPTYIDDATGAQVSEDWWPGMEHDA